MSRKPLPRLRPVFPAIVALTLGVAWLLAGPSDRESFARRPGPPPDAEAQTLALAHPAPVLAPVLAPVMAPVVAPVVAPASKGAGGLLKLVKKHAKRVLRQETARVESVSANWAKLVAAEDLQELQTQLPPAPAKAVKLAQSLLKQALKDDSKAALELDKAQAKLDDVVAKILAIDPSWFDDGIEELSTGSLQVPVLVQEALPEGVVGVKRDPGVATFGLPFAQADAVAVVAGRPALGMVGASVWQFRTLDTWPDGSVRWALCDVETTLDAGEVLAGLQVVSGPGKSGGPAIGVSTTTKIMLDTGPLQAIVRRDDFNLFSAVTVDGQVVVSDDGHPGIVGQALGGHALVPGKNTTVILEENGPARAVVRAEGTLEGPIGIGVIDFTCRITARRDSRDLEVTFTVRNATIKRPQHTVVESVQLVTKVRTLDEPTVRISSHLGSTDQALRPEARSSALLYQTYSTATTAGLGSAQYLPHLPTYPDEKTSFVQKGYLLQIDGHTVHALGQESEFPTHPWLDLSSPAAGLTVGIHHMPYQWPAALEAQGDGTVTVGLFPRQNVAPFTFVWRQHESRSAVFSFHKGTTADPSLPSRKLDAPLTGRAADYGHYDRAGVFAYDLLTKSEHEGALAMMGIAHTIVPDNPQLTVSRYLYKGTSGGANNFAGIEEDLGGDWLRNGTGGDYQDGLDLALYKSEWQIRRSDDFEDSNDPGASNDQVPHSSGHFGDDEHRYREGIVLAYYLTGDARFRDALFDEAEVLVNVSIWPHERSMYLTLRAIAYVAEFTGDAALITALRNRLAYITPPIIDIDSATSGFGWDAAPGQGVRGYYVNSGDNKNEKPPGENFQARGFISGSLGPMGYFHAWRSLPPGDGLAVAARGRMRDLTKWTRWELYPSMHDLADQWLVYSYAVSLKQVTKWENTDFHPILLGMAESWRDTGDAGFLQKGAEQLQAAAAHGELFRWDTRFEVQHFLSAYREYFLGL